MIIRSKNMSEPKSSEITPKSVFDRRKLLLSGSALALFEGVLNKLGAAVKRPRANTAIYAMKNGYSELGTNDVVSEYRDITSYNNFYEFGTDKSDPIKNSKLFKPRPWEIVVDGLCHKPGVLGLDSLLNSKVLQERIYRLRCVEAWSMVVPWIGIPLKDVLAAFDPKSAAKYVRFETVVRPEEMVGQRSRRILPWPYVEGLRIDEAQNNLAILAVGLYGEVLPNQNGAPVRLVVPWKYGFKSIKSIVRISFTNKKPVNTWNLLASGEYGFYANVNPDVDHPRWSQARERRIGDFLRRETLKFNGYEDEVGYLYKGMDLTKYY